MGRALNDRPQPSSRISRGAFVLRRHVPSRRLLSGGGSRMLLWLLLKGVLVGVVIAVPAGPVGVLCIRRTIFHGRLAGFLSGLGAATADAVFGIIAGFGLTVVSETLLEYQEWLRLGGAG